MLVQSSSNGPKYCGIINMEHPHFSTPESTLNLPSDDWSHFGVI